jgi:hypothetical protein
VVRVIFGLIFLCLFGADGQALAAGPIVPRVIAGIYDAEGKDTFEASYLYELAEAPLNHLGLELEYHNAKVELPDLTKRQDVRGVLIWLTSANLKDPTKFFDWVDAAAARKLPILIMGPVPARDRGLTPQSLTEQNRLWNAIGLKNLGGFRPYTYDMRVVHKDAKMVEFERKLPSVITPTDIIEPAMAGAESFLALQRGGDPATRTNVVITTPKGGYVAPGYIAFEDASADWKAWYVNPFALFRKVFRTETMPIADTTTVSGRRIYYSHIDGDGWNSISEAVKYAGKNVTASEVILHEIADRFTALPITVAPIAADLDTNWAGTLKSQKIARAFFELSNIEAGSHTYTHPFEWGFFGPGYTGDAELAFEKRYAVTKIAPGFKRNPKSAQRNLVFPYDVPRAYGDIPFNISREVQGSIAFINTLTPPGKKVQVLQWSGDTRAFPEAMAAVAQAGIANINGWGSRFDGDYPSYTNVAPVGRRIGPYVRVYASHANENEYTALWHGRYFGFRYLTVSLDNTENPRRIKPINVYYHMYSGEKQASLNALLEVMRHVEKQSLAPVSASHYAKIGRGFFDIRFEETGERRWRILNRGALNTIRFDEANSLDVDFVNSAGVIGVARAHGSLYVALDSAVATPTLALTAALDRSYQGPALMDSRWLVSRVEPKGDALKFRAEGFGDGEMAWRWSGAANRTLDISWISQDDEKGKIAVQADKDGALRFALPAIGPEPLVVEMRLRGKNGARP